MLRKAALLAAFLGVLAGAPLAHASDGGSLLGNVWWLSGGHSHASAHYVISRDGSIVQLVHLSDIAWHAGNWKTNVHSVGIEHVGETYDPAGFTTAEYAASAKLVAWLVRRYDIPVDRTHIIGHSEVPDPYHRGLYGGVSHHHDPGPYWNWGHYMYLVRYYTEHQVLPSFVKQMTLHQTPAPAAAKSAAVPAVAVQHAPPQSVVDVHASVHGKAQWYSGIDSWRRWQKHIWKVEFYVDGKLLYADHTWPYSFHRNVGWDSATVSNGSHMLSERIYGTHHYRAWKRIPLRVANPPMHVRVIGAVSGGAVKGLLTLNARDLTAPFTLRWDTTAATEGSHELLVYARDSHGHRAALPLPVMVANAPTFPVALARNWVTHHLGNTLDYSGVVAAR
jgi:hypothetical protein